MIRLYRHALSGHAHRVELLLNVLRLPHENVDVDLAGGEHRTPSFLQRNAFGQVPVIEDGNVVLADSNAILVYLAERYDPARRWYPQDLETRAGIQRWLSVAAGPLAYGPAAARLVTVFGAALDARNAMAIADGLLQVLESHLASRAWLAAEHATIADLAHYAYIAHAPEGGVSLEPYPAVRAWLRRIESIGGFVGMQSTRVGLAA